jgi:hypothetical protein
VGEDIIEPILKSVESTGGGWPVLVLVLFWFSVIGAIVYLARYVLSRQIRINEQRVQERKQEFEAQLQRERDNAANYQNTTVMMVEAFNKNSAAIAEFSGILRPMSETLQRIDHHIQQTNIEARKRNNPGD